MRLLLFATLLTALTACEVKVQSSSDGKKKENYSRNSSKIRNGVELKTTGGIEVKQAFLTYGNGDLVTEDNLTELKRSLILHLIVEGWKEENGKVYLDAEQKVSTSEGDKILDARELFSKNNVESVTPEEAKQITLDVVINSINRLVDHFLVQFKVYNRRNEQAIEGSYKFYIDKM